jgi:hypothetical protein
LNVGLLEQHVGIRDQSQWLSRSVAVTSSTSSSGSLEPAAHLGERSQLCGNVVEGKGGHWARPADDRGSLA